MCKYQYCTNLHAINVNAANKNYQSLDGVFFNKNLTILYCCPCKKEGNAYTLPPTIESIESAAFSGCDSLSSVVLSSSVSTIKEYAFYGCTSLRSIELSKSLTSIGAFAFIYCTNLSEIICPAEVPAWASSDDPFCYTDYTTATLYVPESSIDAYRTSHYCWSKFQNIEPIANESASDSVSTSTIYDDLQYFISGGGTCSVMCGMDTLSTQVVIPQEIIYSGETFTVTVIGDSAFYNYKDLIIIEIPNSITSIGTSAFQGCEDLTEIVCHATDPIATEDEYTFSDSVYAHATLYVPEESVETYRTSEYCWSKFQNIQPMSLYSDIRNVTYTSGTIASTVIYDLNGRRCVGNLQNLAPGIYVARRGGKRYTILVK